MKMTVKDPGMRLAITQVCTSQQRLYKVDRLVNLQTFSLGVSGFNPSEKQVILLAMIVDGSILIRKHRPTNTNINCQRSDRLKTHSDLIHTLCITVVTLIRLRFIDSVCATRYQQGIFHRTLIVVTIAERF